MLLRVAALVPLVAVAADLPSWGAQDIWVHTSAWTPEHCQCFCERLCSHPTEYLKTNLVSSSLVPRNNDWTVPQCEALINIFSPAAIRAVGQADLVKYFPLTMSRDLEHMWDPTSTSRRDVGYFGQPCGGLHETTYLKTVVQLGKFVKTPPVIKDNIGKNVSTQAIRDAFKKEQGLDVVLLCTDGAFADVVTCWSKSTPFAYQTSQASQEIAPAKAVQCPPDIAALDSCTAPTSYIAPFLPSGSTSAPTTAPPTTAPVPSTPSPTVDPDAVDAWVKNFTKTHGCALFGEEGCSYCAKAKALLKSKDATYAYQGIDDNSSTPLGMDIYYSLVRLTHQDTLPNIWIGSQFIGGSSDLQDLQDKGKLDAMLAAAGCTKPAPTTAQPTQDPAQVEAFVKKFTSENGCVVFGEAKCDACAKVKSLFALKRASFEYKGVDDQSSVPTGSDIFRALVRMTKQETVPSVWINGAFVGGADDVQALADKDELNALLYEAGCFLW